MQNTRRYTSEHLLYLIKRFNTIFLKVPSCNDFRERRDLPSPQTYWNRFGSWRNAVKRAGLKVSHGRQRYTLSILVPHLQMIIRELGRLPHVEDFKRFAPPSFGAYRKHFGSIKTSLELAGVKNPNTRLKYDRDQLIQLIKKEKERLGRTPYAYEVTEHNQIGQDVYLVYFGSWERALELAGAKPPVLSKEELKDKYNMIRNKKHFIRRLQKIGYLLKNNNLDKYLHYRGIKGVIFFSVMARHNGESVNSVIEKIERIYKLEVSPDIVYQWDKQFRKRWMRSLIVQLVSRKSKNTHMQRKMEDNEYLIPLMDGEDRRYSVIAEDGGYSCECSSNSRPCKHVLFLKTYHLFKQGRIDKRQAEMGTLCPDGITCPNCKSLRIVKHSVRKNKLEKKQRWLCRNCSKVFVLDPFINAIRNQNNMNAAMDLYMKGRTFRGIKKELEDSLKLRINHATAWYWIHAYIDRISSSG